MMGGIATAKENSQINCTYLDVRQVTCVVTCHDRSCHITDVNRIAAIAVSVYSELMPKRKTAKLIVHIWMYFDIEYDACLAYFEYKYYHRKLYEQMLQMGKEKHPRLLLL